MRISATIIVLNVIAQNACAFWAAAARGIEPVILSVGAAFAALGLNDHSNKDV